jgi:hypothetical protein
VFWQEGEWEVDVLGNMKEGGLRRGSVEYFFLEIIFCFVFHPGPRG